MARRLSVTPFMAETTTTTLAPEAASRTSLAACTIRSAPASELPPNLNASVSRDRARDTLAPGAKSPAWLDSSETSGCSSGLMTVPRALLLYGLLFELPQGRLITFLEGSERRNPPPGSLQAV